MHNMKILIVLFSTAFASKVLAVTFLSKGCSCGGGCGRNLFVCGKDCFVCSCQSRCMSL